jgi:hypothetical protein
LIHSEETQSATAAGQSRTSQAVHQDADERGMFEREPLLWIQPKARLERLNGKYQQQFQI